MESKVFSIHGNYMKNVCLVFMLMLFSRTTTAAPGSPLAKTGGDFYYNLSVVPTTLHPLSSTDAYARIIQSYTLDSLLNRDPDTNEWVPGLAESWSISKDGMNFEFKLREGATWHDGKPVTVEDVKFSFDAIVEPTNKYKTAALKPYYENIKSVDIVDNRTVRFVTKKKYFLNFDQAAELTVIPKHIYENPSKEQEKKLNTTIMGSGPYTLESFDRSKKIVLKRNEKWWGRNNPDNKGEYNFDRIHMRYVADDTIALTMLEKGDLDFLTLSPEPFMKKTTGPKWGKSVFKKQISNKAPIGYAFLGWNLQDPLFTSKKTRLALYHLINRKMMIDKFMFGMAEPAIGPVFNRSPYANPEVKAVEFDPKKALELLKEDGWGDSDGDKILDKTVNGQKLKLSFTILEPLQDFVKYLTIFKEDAKKIGVDVNIKFVEWNTFIKLLEEHKFQALRLAWGAGGLEWDPKQIWHSESIANSGSNFIGYKNPQVDKLIDEARETMDKPKRIKLLREVYKIIADDVPYAFFFNSKFGFYAHTQRMRSPKDTYNYTVGTSYWWIDK